ncbi:MAG: Nif3-like dinuclear metal center hexameric protein [Erysipelotrichia bacterium]|jgi:dinuclear metal center YbgI/SA1388 family protein|nr:Nif3-like dinuclear metal center hexameric protein [Bacilli bacterium]NLB49238.1 Nif3-like dinuclear metal center hexameric protein [Erysipelotrichia bacterium]
MKTKVLLARLAKRFPKRIAKKYHDYVGLMVGKLPLDVNKILLCLDFDEEVLPFVIEEKPDLIITHHPFIYGTRAKVLKHDEKKKALYEKIEALKIPVYSIHTNFDEGKGGMNDALSAKLGLKDVYAPSESPMMRCGRVENPLPIKEFALKAKKAFEVEYGLLIAHGVEMISTVGIIGGGGSREWTIARDNKIDIYLSGDAPHHVRRDIVTSNYNYLDLPHEIEKIFLVTMKDILLSYDSSLEIVIIDHEKVPLVI